MRGLKKIALGLVVLALISEFAFPKSMFQLKLFVQSFSAIGALVLFFVSKLPMWKE